MSFLDNNPLSFIFGTKPGAGVPTYEQLQMRRKIAESLLGQRSKYPKTFGEGLSAIGEAIGERGMMSRLDAIDQAAEAQNGPEYNRLMGGSAPAAAAVPMAKPMSYAPEDAGTGPVAAAATTGGFNPAPAYLQQALANSGLPPERQAYLGHLAGKEAQSAGEVSSTGAAGPFQFIKSTGQQYGLVGPNGDRRTNIPASIDAVNRLTDDNAATLRKGLGREPTPGELALAHQQGAGTAVKMLSGTGNAPAYNLGVNNAGGLGGPAAAQKIMKYYGMPGAGPQSSVVDPGLNQNVALDQTASPAPSGPPMAFSGQPASDAPPMGAPPDARMAITNALTPKPPPVVAPPVPPAPAGPQIAQAPPQQQIRVPQGEVSPPDAPHMTQKMRDIIAFSGKISPNDPRQRGLQSLYQQLQATEQAKFTQQQEEYKYQRGQADTAPQRAADLAKAHEELKKLQEDSQTRVQEKQIEMAKKAQDFQQSQIASAPTSMIAGAPKVAGVSNVALQGGNDPRLGTPESPQRSGVPNIGPPPTGISPQKWNEVQAPIMAKATDTYEKAIPKMQELLDTIKTANEHPGRAWGVGSGSNIAKSIPGTSAYGFGKLMEQVAGKNFLEAYQILKGGGQITEIEGTKAEAAQARLNTAQSKEDFDKSMIDFENAVRNDMERVQRKMNSPVTAWRPPGDNTSTAPDKGQVGSRKGKLVEYIGGNPALDESYKAVH